MILKLCHRFRFFLIVTLLTAVATSQSSFSQDKEIISPYITFQYFKDTDNHRFLQTTLTYSKNRMELPLPGMEISFFTGDGRGKSLAEVITSEKGIARYPVDDNMILPVDKDGNWTFSTIFKGNDTIEAGSSELAVKNVDLQITLSMVDTIKTIRLNAKMAEGVAWKPVTDETVLLYVPRMFSLLPVGEASLDENGVGTVEFPSDLPGDAEGNLTIIARFEEHPLFGNVERSISEKWGVPKILSGPTTHRALWTKTPPMWMIITLSILLTGVWGHYLFAVISLFLIKKDANKQVIKKGKETIG